MRLQIAVPANTPVATPLVTRAQFMQGQALNHELILAPYGHMFMTGIRLYVAGENQWALPEPGSITTPPGWIVLGGNRDATYERNIHIPLEPPKYLIEVWAYNTSTLYAHTFYVDLE